MPLTSLLSKAHLAIPVGLYVTLEYCMSVVNIPLKEKCPIQTICQAWKTSINSFT